MSEYNKFNKGNMYLTEMLLVVGNLMKTWLNSIGAHSQRYECDAIHNLNMSMHWCIHRLWLIAECWINIEININAEMMQPPATGRP